jgi:hypothetical protein
MAGAGFVRALYTRASQAPALRAPLERMRSHPRVRAFARRRVTVLLASGTTWANVDGALRLLSEDRTRPVAFGHWPGDETTELLYWAPFVRWAQQHFDLRVEATPGATVFPAEPVAALVEEYRRGEAPLRPLAKRAIYERLQGDATAVVAEYGAAAIRAALAGAPVVALHPRDRELVEPDVDLAVRIVSGLGGFLVVLGEAHLERLREALR